MGSETADWGLLYSKAGWRSFPVTPAKKNPVYKNWLNDATLDPKMVRQYFPPGTDRNLGLVCGEKFDAWDIEVDHLTRFGEWMHERGYALPEAPLASTGRGGMHILTAPTGVDGSRNLYLEGKHIGELKSRGGFILACPSETDQMYLWINLTERLAVPEAPAWLLGLLERPKTGVHRLPSRIAAVEDIKPRLEALGRSIIAVRAAHMRNAYLYWAVIRAVEEGAPADIASEALLDAFMAAAMPGDDATERRREGQKTVESALQSVAA